MGPWPLVATLDLARFSMSSRGRLDALGPEGVRSAIDRRAASLRPSQRDDFLELFGPPAPTPVDELEAAINRFLGDIERLAPVDRWHGRDGWSDDEFEASPEAETCEDLLVAVGERFLAGDITWVTGAYQRIFSAVTELIDDDRGIEITVDVELASEARDRLLWCLADSAADAPAAAEAMLACLDRTELVTRAPTVSELVSAHPARAPIDDDTLRAFANLIIDGAAESKPWEARWRLGLALEIRTQLDGVDAVLVAARTAGGRRLHIYEWIVEHLRSNGEAARAADLADEAIDGEPNSWPVADLADTAADLWRELAQPEHAWNAQERAWVCNPTITRLERLLDDAEATGRHALAEGFRVAAATDGFLAVALAVLDGDPGAAIAAAQQANVNGRVGYAAQQLAIASACRAATAAVSSRLVDEIVNDALARATRSERRHDPFDDDRRGAATGLGERLQRSFASLPIEPGAIGDARRLVDEVAETVLGAKDRRHYRIVATVVVLLAHSSGALGASSLNDVIEEYDRRYRRFSTFRGELRDTASVRRATGLPVTQVIDEQLRRERHRS